MSRITRLHSKLLFRGHYKSFSLESKSIVLFVLILFSSVSLLIFLQVKSYWVPSLSNLNQTHSPLIWQIFIKDSGGQGFIIASFGSYAKMTISNRTIDVLAAAFGKLKQKIIWKHKGNLKAVLAFSSLWHKMRCLNILV